MTDPTGAPEGTPPIPPTPADKDLQAEIGKWKEMARKHETRAKENYAELEKLKASDDAKKSDMDKIMAKLEASEKRSQEAERKALYGEVVAETGLSMAKVARLQGNTVEELMTDAEAVFDWKPKPDGDGDGKPVDGDKPPAPVPVLERYGRPKEKLTPDPGAGAPPVVDDRSKILAAIPRL